MHAVVGVVRDALLAALTQIAKVMFQTSVQPEKSRGVRSSRSGADELGLILAATRCLIYISKFTTSRLLDLA